MVAMGFFKTLSKTLGKATNPYFIRLKRWLPLGTTLRTESYGDVIQYGQKLKLMKVDLRELQLVA